MSSVAAMPLWALGLSSTKSNQDAPTAQASTEEPATTAPLDFLDPNLQTYPAGSFPQVVRDFETFDDTAEFDVATAQASINAPMTISDAHAALSETNDGFDLLIHFVVQDNNGLSEPAVRQAASQALVEEQGFFKGAMFTSIDIDLIDKTTALVEWQGQLQDDLLVYYYPLNLDIIDNAGFAQDFSLQLPILNSEILGDG